MCGSIYKLFYKAESADKVASRSKNILNRGRLLYKQTARSLRL